MERSYCRLVVMVDGRRALQTNKKGFLYHLDDEIMENWIIFHKKEAAVNKKKWRKKGCKVAKKVRWAYSTLVHIQGKKTKASLWIYLSLTIIWLGRTDIDKKETLFSSIDLRESEWKKIRLGFLHRFYQPMN